MKKDKTVEPEIPVEPEINGFLEPQMPLVPLEPEMSIEALEHPEPVAPPYIPEPQEQLVLPEQQLIPIGQQQKSLESQKPLELMESPKIVLISTPTNTTTLFEVMARKQRKELKSIELQN